jgi:hypothetical protein
VSITGTGIVVEKIKKENPTEATSSLSLSSTVRLLASFECCVCASDVSSNF